MTASDQRCTEPHQTLASRGPSTRDPGIHGRHCFAVPYWAYILPNSKKGTFYVGVTRDLVRHVFQHRERQIHGFTSRDAVTRLVHDQQYEAPVGRSSARKT